ncbi:hypothetical protein Tco_0033555 [Tanacetum coccineum]
MCLYLGLLVVFLAASYYEITIIFVKIMAASAIAISSDSSDESVGSPPSRVILFGDIPTVIPSTSVVAPETYYCYHGPSSSHEFPIAPVTAPPGIRRRSATLIRPGEAIPFGRPYRTHLNGPRKLLTARKRVRPLPARRLASRHASPRSPDHHSSSSVHLRDLFASYPFVVWMRQIRLIRDLRLEMYHLDCVTLRGEHHDVVRHFVNWWLAPLSNWYPRTYIRVSLGDSSERPNAFNFSVAGTISVLRFIVMEVSIEEDAEVGLYRDGFGYGVRRRAGDMLRVVIDPMTAPLVGEEIVRVIGLWIENCHPQRRFWRCPISWIASGDKGWMAEMIYSLRMENLMVRAMLDIERDRVSSLRLHMSLSQEEFRQIRRDRDDARGRLRSLELYLGRRFGFRP